MRAFVESDWFQRLPVKPISLYRAESYLANPHALPDDPLIYYWDEEDKIVSFRSVFPAAFNHEEERFAWLSGAWTQLDFRKRGLSLRLLDEIYKDWDGRLAATNFSPNSRRLYERSTLLKPFCKVSGRRFYLFVNSRKLLEGRMGNLVFLWPVIDNIARLWARNKLRKHRLEKHPNIRWEKHAFPDRECMEMVNQQQSDYLFKRGEVELKWILSYPWLSTDDRTFKQSYPFSSYAKQFEVYTVKFYREEKFLGLLIYSLRDGHLKLLDQHFTVDCKEAVAHFFINESVAKRVEMLTILHTELAERIAGENNPFLFSKEFQHHIYSSIKRLPQNSKIQAGEGDFMWT
ncbi:GNAT family N-acetyltransferase [Mangrovibacterium lignilyticum]|uniref:GNAT family N-acetyltransferase n=1 Tax=Mangrovibacterium lignilyticum TaxID=2668052 RepID=UPI0013D0DC31|nr:hypothetical protein [Mangrovibacterium lignilyticum]